MRILVTGGSGYIGTRLLRALAAREDIEELVDLDLRPPATAIPKVRPVVRSVTEDLRDLFAGIDVAMHLAWLVDPLHDAARQRAICIGGSERFLEGCAAGGVRHVFFMSSGTAYGAHPAHFVPLDEQSPLREQHHFQYSAEKREGEGLFQRFAEAHPGVLLQIARPCIVGGPNVSNFIFRSVRRRFAARPAGVDPLIQLVHEDDCASALVAIVTSRLAGAFNVAADGALHLSEIAARSGARLLALPMPLLTALVAIGWHLRIRALAEAPPGYLHFLRYPWLLSNRRLKSELGFQFRYTAEEAFAAWLAAI